MADSQADKPLKTYRGNCHCGAFVYEVQLPEIESVISCNCSLCTKKSYEWVFVAKEEHFKVAKGQESDLTTYTFGPKVLEHKFCPTCGVAVLGRRASQAGPGSLGAAAINARTIQDLESWKLTKVPYDGAAVGDKYEPPAYTGPEPTVEIEGAKLYTGSCHCGAVTVALKSKPIEELPMIRECTCSICHHNGYMWMYPEANQIVLQGEDNLGRYLFGVKHLYKTFCKTCGVQFTNDWRDLNEEEVAAMDPQKRQFYQNANHFRPLNLRVLNNVDLSTLKPELSTVSATIGMKYVNP
jgi:hypothetical protein